MSTSNDPLLTDVELSAKIGRSKNWLAKQRMTGEGPVFLKIGNSVRYRQSAVDEWLRACECKSTGDNPRRAS